MAHTARVKKVLDEATALSPSEFEELVAGLEEVRERLVAGRYGQTGGPRCGGAELVQLLKGLTPDPAFADDIEAAVRAMRSEPVTSLCDR